MSAIISNCGQYRYELGRVIGGLFDSPGVVVWVLCNPSTADATEDDPTIRKCIGFTKRWGYDKLLVVNAYALRSTNPKALLVHQNPMGDNVEHVARAFRDHKGDMLVFGWGDALPRKLREPTRLWLGSLARNEGVEPMCFGRTKNGQPRHPLMLAYETKLEKWLLYQNTSSR